MPQETPITDTPPGREAWYQELWRDVARSQAESAADPDGPSLVEEAGAFLRRVAEQATFAFQPIVSIHTGACYGYEALLRSTEALDLPDIASVFNRGHGLGCLHALDLVLREKAVRAFTAIDRPAEARLFFDLDPRTVMAEDFRHHRTQEILERHGLAAEILCLELSDRHADLPESEARRLIEHYRGEGYRLAIDNFGSVASGLKLLHDHQPDFVKIDRFFISGMAQDTKKKLFVATMANLAHVLGTAVIAVGVETEAEFTACKQIGCDLVQGHFIQRPTPEAAELHPSYERVRLVTRRERRDEQSDQRIIYDEIRFLPPLRIDDGMEAVFEAFRRNRDHFFFPVIDRSGEPLGLVRETDFKDYAYSPYGRELIVNKGYGRTLRDFLRPCPVADIQTEAEKILEIFSAAEEPEGIIITADFSYVGFLTAASLLRIINSKNLAQAQDQNPLTRLPGNASINDFVAAALEDAETQWVLVYFDFNNFKPFNDTYGFRQGDRAILLFAELMRKHLDGPGTFLGHVGGDDFFAGFRDTDPETANARVRDLLAVFARDVESFYDADAQACGCIKARDRDGNERCFPLLACSAAALHLPAGERRGSLDDVVSQFATMKKSAKASPDGFSYAAFL